MCDRKHHDEVKPVPTEPEYMVERHVTSTAQREPRCAGPSNPAAEQGERDRESTLQLSTLAFDDK